MYEPVEFKILGPLEAVGGGGPVDLGPYKQRLLLGALLLQANIVVPVDQLMQTLWPQHPPRTARKNLQVYISTLRKIVGDRVDRVSYGYLLHVDPGDLDALAFDELAIAGHAVCQAGDRESASRMLGKAVGLWRDDALVDLADNPVIAAESERLHERFLAVYEDWVDLEIEAGRHLPITDRLIRETHRHPFRERLAASAMTALYRGGRRREALAMFEAHRQLVARELGVGPSPVLQRLYRAMLTDVSSPARSASAERSPIRPAQLPRDLPDFVGRAAQTEALVASLTGTVGVDVAVVTGAAGTGKTALAVHAGHRLATSFDDGHVFVSLRAERGETRPLRGVLAELMYATGLRDVPDDELEALAAWRSWIADRAFLLILDDATEEAQVRRLLPGRGRSRTIVTSCRRLSGLESVHRIETGELSEEEAVELLARVIGADRAAGAGVALRRIAEHCGTTPLVVRSLASRLNVLRHLTVADLADRVGSARSILDELTIGDLSVRQRLRRAHADLPPAQQRAIRLLGGLPDLSATHGELADAFGQLDEPADRVVEGLLEANMIGVPDFEVLAHAVQYTVPALVRGFATELAELAELADTQESAG